VNGLRWRRRLERSLTLIRLGGLLVACVDAGFLTDYPARSWEVAAFVTTAVAVVGSVAIGLAARSRRDLDGLRRLGWTAFVFDFAVVASYVAIYQFEPGAPIRELLIFPVAEGAVRFARRGALGSALVAIGVLAAAEVFRSHHFAERSFNADHVVFPGLVLLLTGLILGWLVRSLREESEVGRRRAGEAEALRDQIGRRADLIDATNRCARALASSLDLEQAFAAFAREVAALVPYDRMSLILAQEHGDPRVLAVAGAHHDVLLPSGSTFPPSQPVRRALAGETVYRADMDDGQHAEEDDLVRAGLRSRILAPLALGPVPIGILAIARSQPDAFEAEEVELVTLLARIVAHAVQNIRAYSAEKATADELRRLSTLRADFVSLVSHELRSPMAAVIGAARTLHERWRDLRVDQREAFLDLIADETGRLADLIGDVLDTSRIEAGTFSYSFAVLDLGDLVQETVSSAQVAQDEVAVRLDLATALPLVSGDRARLRQVVANLIDNAVKYSPVGRAVEVAVYAAGEDVVVTVSDSGPGIPPEHHGLIFEKFGRTKIGGAKPGTGLGLFIARSIAEAHGGSLTVSSNSGAGATFALRVPVSASVPSAAP
jgi:signal transduction histidine kinase